MSSFPLNKLATTASAATSSPASPRAGVATHVRSGRALALKQAVTPETRGQVRKLSHQLEAVFVNQLFQAMRASVPKDPVLDNAPGAEMFTQIMDEKLANQASDHLQRGLGESLYRQLARRLPEAPEGTAP